MSLNGIFTDAQQPRQSSISRFFAYRLAASRSQTWQRLVQDLPQLVHAFERFFPLAADTLGGADNSTELFLFLPVNADNVAVQGQVSLLTNRELFLPVCGAQYHGNGYRSVTDGLSAWKEHLHTEGADQQTDKA